MDEDYGGPQVDVDDVIVGDDDDMLPSNVVVEHMDITEPLTILRDSLEKRLDLDFKDYFFYLQDTQRLDSDKNLVEQCVAGEGQVQVNVEINFIEKKLNIVDVLKTTEEFAEVEPEPDAFDYEKLVVPSVSKVIIPKKAPKSNQSTDNVTRWTASVAFKREQERLNIPTDPKRWSTDNVQVWLKWAIEEFQLQVDAQQWESTDGPKLVKITRDEFSKRVTHDPKELFWTHVELLRQLKFVAVVQEETSSASNTINEKLSVLGKSKKAKAVKRQPLGLMTSSAPRMFGNCTAEATEEGDSSLNSSRIGNNGQIQLWQFLLEILTDKDYREVIQWYGNEGEFKLVNPEMVATLWGKRKNKPNMNYEKLSRALRYYYDGDMISKVHGRRFVYKFVCDLRHLLGYNAAELNRLVHEHEQSHQLSVETQRLRNINRKLGII